MRRMLLNYSGHSALLRAAVVKLTMLLTRVYPPWEAYRGMMVDRLVGFDKMPGVRPLGIGDMIHRLVEK